MKHIAMIAVWALVLSGCKSNPTIKPKIYSLEEVTKELEEGNVKLGAPEADVRAFFKSHPTYHVCKDYSGAGLIAVMRNSRVDPKSDDQYVVITYRDGTVDQMNLGPPQFSVGNLPSYCP